MKRKRSIKIVFWVFALLFILMNIIAFMHAYKFTHFSDPSGTLTKNPGALSRSEKIKAVFLGVSNPRPVNTNKPSQRFETIKLKSNKEIECWSISADSSNSTVLIFHGYRGDKSRMLDKANFFLEQGYNVLLVDFMGSGGSEGNQTTIGFKEANEVKTCFDYAANKNQKIYLFGTSMGAVAIMKAIQDHKIIPTGIILECPFGTMYKTTCARFKNMGIPSFPMAGLLLFWGSLQNGFWGFSHNPERYATSIKCPTLLLYGEKDDRVSNEEINKIYNNLNGEKTLKTFPLAGHENYFANYESDWIQYVSDFLKTKIK